MLRRASFRLDLEMVKRTRNLPLPLGGNVIRKDIPPEIRHEISDILRESIAYGLEHRSPAVLHSMAHARGLDIPLADRHRDVGQCSTLIMENTGALPLAASRSEAVDQRLIPPVTGLEFEN